MIERRADVDHVVDLLSAAADALLTNNTGLAVKLVGEADDRQVWSWFYNFVQTDNIWKHLNLDPKARVIVGVKVATRDTTTASMKRELFTRDGWHCRFCEVPVVSPAARKILTDRAGLRWGSRKQMIHGGMVAVLASHDHVMPRSWGGADSLDNLVTACWPCQFSRLNGRLADCGLADPFTHPPVLDGWDGLTRLLSKPSKFQALGE